MHRSSLYARFTMDVDKERSGFYELQLQWEEQSGNGAMSHKVLQESNKDAYIEAKYEPCKEKKRSMFSTTQKKQNSTADEGK